MQTEAEGKDFFGAVAEILLADGTGRLGAATEAERAAWHAALVARQDPATGLFAPGEEGVGEALAATAAALQALDALDAAPPHPLAFLGRLSTPPAARAWLDALDWSAPGPAASAAAELLACLVHDAERRGDAAAGAVAHALLDGIGERQDAEAGLWGDGPAALAAGARLMPLHDYLNRPVRYVPHIIDTALRLRKSWESWPEPGGEGEAACLDAILLLACCATRASYRQPDIEAALFRLRAPLELAAQAAAANATETPEEAWRRRFALALVRMNTPPQRTGEWRFPRRPLLGYFRPGAALPPHEEAVLPLWAPRSQVAVPLPPSAEPPTVTVVIPCFNLGRYLNEAVDSVLGQTFQDFEIVIADDGSTDPYTRGLLEIFERPKTRILRHANMGLPATRNDAIRQSRGRYVSCLDADDVLAPTFLEKAVAALDANEKAGFVTGHYRTFDGDDWTVTPSSCNFPELLVTNAVMVAALFRRAAWETVGGYCETMTGIQDWDFWISIVEAGYEAVVLPEILFHYRVRPDSMLTVTRRPEHFQRLNKELAERHAASFVAHLPEVLGQRAAQLSQAVDYVRALREDLKREKEARALLAADEPAEGAAAEASPQPETEKSLKKAMSLVGRMLKRK